MIKIKIKNFGIYTEILGNEIILNLEKNLTLSELKFYMIENIFHSKIDFLKETFTKSLFSNEENILTDDYIIKDNDTIYLLPPFSGG